MPSISHTLFNSISTITFCMFQAYMWTVERNLDTDLDFQEASVEEHKAAKTKDKVEKGAGKRRHSLANFLHLK